jgi:hypothetical protein
MRAPTWTANLERQLSRKYQERKRKPEEELAAGGHYRAVGTREERARQILEHGAKRAVRNN